MSLEEVSMTAGGGAKWNASLDQGAQVSPATQRAATTTRHRHTQELSGDTYQPLYSPGPAKREGRGRGKLPHKGTICSSKKLHNLQERAHVIWSLSKPICQIGVHDLQLPLTSIGSILT